ncbi:acyl carrier protein [uncultured Tateyamaria sp.]|uniref:acyl carrier protein n=1 Tax=uncultured Tateyamaria sp. TaxID=455651 RepID=UPI00262FF3A5|nr:acyl carrier protein [uncultured Tateyamaria sp.]
MTDALSTLKNFVAETLNVPVEGIDIDKSIEDLGLDDEEWRDALEHAAQVHNVPMADLLNTMPVYRIKRGDMAMDSLRDLAAFSPRASAMLHEFTTRIHVDTVRSLAQSVEARRYVESGQMSDSLHKPNTPLWVIGKGIVLTALATGVPFFNMLAPCNPLRTYCFAPASTKYWEAAQFTLPVFGVVLLFWLGPGLYEIRADIKKQKARRKSATACTGTDA